MSLREIPPGEWRSFLDEFSRGHRAWRASVERRRPTGSFDMQAVERPLRAVISQVSAGRVARIEIQFQQDEQLRDALRIDAPVRVRVDETPEGTSRALEIDDESGECTRIQFRSAPLPEALDGLAPGEL